MIRITGRSYDEKVSSSLPVKDVLYYGFLIFCSKEEEEEGVTLGTQ